MCKIPITTNEFTFIISLKNSRANIEEIKAHQFENDTILDDILTNPNVRRGMCLKNEVLEHLAEKTEGKILNRVLGERLIGEMFGMAFVSNHMLFDIFNRKFRQLFTTGLISRIAEKYKIPVKSETYARFKEPIGPKILTMEHLKGSFILCFVPLVFCAAVFICEWLFKLGEFFMVTCVVLNFYKMRSSYSALKQINRSM